MTMGNGLEVKLREGLPTDGGRGCGMTTIAFN